MSFKTVLFLVLICTATTLAILPYARAHDQLTPHQREILNSPAKLIADTSFSFEAPVGPQFTAAEKETQRERGQGLMPLIKQAFQRGDAEVRIPPGDYRFGQESYVAGKLIYPLSFENMQRDANDPFVIDATGSTFWFDLGDEQMPPGHRCVLFSNCRNITLRGAILDRATLGCIEGRITQIDREKNRFEIEPSHGVVVPEKYKGGDEQRLIPFKSDGRFCAPLYDLQPGIRKLRYKDITPSTSGRYWINMLDPDLIARVNDTTWERVYGDLGVLRVGDGLSCIYTGANAIALEDSANITLHGVSVYIAKGGPSESGGDGAHLWKDCYFGPRPGTNQWKGADGFLCRSTRYGSIFDNVTIRHTADDLQNFHGIWGKVQTVAGNKITLERNWALRPTINNARPGDRLRLVHRYTGVILGEAKLTAIREFEVTVDQDATPFAEAQAEWLDHECAGWVVQNCRWEDSFQRLLIMSGPGTVRGCKFTRIGSNISLNTGMGLVGGIPNDITIAENTFVDVNPRSNGTVIEAFAHNARGQIGVPPIERMVVNGNTFLRCGGPSINLMGVKDSRVEQNRFESPLYAALMVKPDDQYKQHAVMLRQSTSIILTGNKLHDPKPTAQSDAITKSGLVGMEGATGIILDGKPLPDLAK